jgi:hypothetical protein
MDVLVANGSLVFANKIANRVSMAGLVTIALVIASQAFAEGVGIGFMVGCSVLALTLFIVGCRYPRQKAVIDDKSLTVKNLFRTYVVHWDKIVKVDVARPYGRSVFRNGIQITTTSGHSFYIAASAPTPTRGPAASDELLTEIRERVSSLPERPS